MDSSLAISEAESVFLILVRCIVDAPESVSLNTETVGSETVFHLQVAKTDLGKVIGKQGRSARALRTLLHATSVKHGLQYSLDIDDETNSGRQIQY